MNKAHVTHFLSDYLEGSLPHAGIEKVKAHLAFCNACRQALSETERHINLLKSTPNAQVPAGLEARVLTRIHQELEQEPAESAWGRFLSPSWFTPLRGLALAATCGIAIMVVRNMPKNVERPTADKLVRSDGRAEEGQATGGLSLGTEVESMMKKKSEAFGVRSKDLAGAARGATGTVDKEAPAAEQDGPAEASEKRASLQREAASAVTLESALVPMEGSRSAIEEPLETVVSNQADWEALWKRHTANVQSPPPLPAVDFKTRQVLAIFAGERPTGGFRVEVIETLKTTWNSDTVRVVHFRIVGPPPGVMAAQVISYPYLLLIQPRCEGLTFFQKRH